MFRSLGALLALILLAGCNDIGSMRRRRDTEGLINLMSDEDPRVRIKAIDALGKVGDSRTAEHLIKALRDPNPYVREHAARNLGCDYHSSLGCELRSTVAPLIDALDDEDAFVRVEAARSLGENPHAEAREPLERIALSDRRWEVKASAVESLGRIGLPESTPVVEALIENGEPQVQLAARHALRRLSTGASPPSNRLPRLDELPDLDDRDEDEAGGPDAGQPASTEPDAAGATPDGGSPASAPPT